MDIENTNEKSENRRPMIDTVFHDSSWLGILASTRLRYTTSRIISDTVLDPEGCDIKMKKNKRCQQCFRVSIFFPSKSPTHWVIHQNAVSVRCRALG